MVGHRRGEPGATSSSSGAAEALASWRAKRFELPDYYLVLAEEAAPGGDDPGAAGPRADFYLGPLRAVRPNRVSVAAGASPEAQAAALLSELGSLRHGPWWPPLDEVFRTARASTLARWRSPRRRGGPACCRAPLAGGRCCGRTGAAAAP